MSTFDNLFFKIDIASGSNIHDSCKELCEFATLTNREVYSKFNTIMLRCSPNDDYEKLIETYFKELSEPTQW